MFERWLAQIRGQASAAASPAAEDRMAGAVALWGGLYRGQAPWLAEGGGLELPAAIACELGASDNAGAGKQGGRIGAGAVSGRAVSSRADAAAARL